ncbi:hypothetical protein BT63DRAFT_408995 [Microthyrium microscopicum]|uniref:Nucleoside 2-deoxyribosyltransferase like n=1 Tax=Microthyrium microscopicum TaxID=703497 RepID=A0A6A6UTP5_9PEZI|nr:hypothetical protein BT63DRAFT_408995 [Microthyrium microscopicum]
MSSSTHPDFKHVKAPHKVELNQPSVFLAGSIEMGKAILWQDSMSEQLQDLPVTVLNPRREDWNSEWKQTEDFGPFKQQVDWEMDYLNDCDVIALYFQVGTMSPISLLELGLHAASGKVVVCCPTGFWRKGNVDIVCSRYGLNKPFETIEELIAETRSRLAKACEAKETAKLA